MLSLLIEKPDLFVILVLIVIVSICIHELFHGLAALDQGDDTPIRTGHMTWNPVVHMGWESIVFLCVAGIAWGAMPVTPAKFRSPRWGNALVSAAGPLSNLLLSMLAILLLRWLVATDAQNFVQLGSFILLQVALINVKLFLLNLLPIPPLDGFGIFSEIFPSLKSLDHPAFGLAALMLLFLTPIGSGLDLVANWFVVSSLGTAFSNLYQVL